MSSGPSRRLAILTVFMILCCALRVSAQQAAPQSAETLIPGYSRFRAEHLQPAEAGRLLIAEMNCQSCHGTFSGLTVAPRQAPILTAAAGRLNPEHVRRFLANPHQQKPGTAMPQIPAAASSPENLDALTAFVTAGSTWRPQAVSSDAIRRGEEQYHRIGCAACHGDLRSDEAIIAIRRGLAPPNPDEDEDAPKDATAPTVERPGFLMPLGPLHEKYNLGGLIAFLREPHTVRPSGRMPSLGLSPDDARDIASFLLKDVKVAGSIQYEYFEGGWDKLPDFTKLKPVSSGTTTDFSAGPANRGDDYALRFSGYLQIATAGEYRIHSSSDDGSRVLVNEEEVVNNDGIHPPVGRSGVIALKAGSHTVVVEFFEKGGGEELTVEIEGPGLPRQPLSGSVTLTREPPKPAEKTAAPPSPELIAKGRLLFAQLGCASCHQHGDGDQRVQPMLAGPAPAFADARPDSGCLAVSSEKAPRFAFSDRQRSDLQAAITASRQERSPASTPAAEARSVMLSLNCFACHSRGGIGGPSEPLNHVFTGTIPEMGDEGRVPPPLDGAGDKLSEDWLRRLLNEGGKDRPYMHTRMPAFGAQHADVLVPRLAADRQAEVPVPEFAEADHRIKADARLLVGDKALSCIKCHRFDNLAATGLQSLDMTTMTTRLRRDWFHRYLLDPQKYRPGTRMPAAWPGGNSIIPHVLDGNSVQQIEAIWRYLQDGNRAKVPSGLERQSIVLVPEQRPLIYRNFIEGLSPRGIAVGFPEKVHFAWDAEHMTPRLIWHGAFIDAAKHWVDRGPGFQSPLGDHVMTLPQGPPLAMLASLDEAWPGKNSRELGYQFRGYRLSPSGQPTFRVDWQDRQLFDTIEPLDNSPDFGLKRTLELKSANPLRGLWLRIAAGNITDKNGSFVCDGVQYTITGGLPIVRQSGDREELLVQLPDGVNAAKVFVEIRW